MANEFIARKGIISLDSIQVTGSITATGGITISGSISSASFATTAATASSADNFFIRQNVTASGILATGTITAQTLVVQTVTSSIVYSSGSNIFGNQLTDTQRFTGSMFITGSTLNVNGGSICATRNMCIGGMGIVASCLGVGTATPITSLHVVNGGNNFLTLERSGATNSKQFNINIEANSQTTISYDCVTGLVVGSSCNPNTQTGFNERLKLFGSGIACFACQVCAPSYISTGNVGVGTAPYAWRTGLSDIALDVGATTGLYYQTGGSTVLFNNAYRCTGNNIVYKTTGTGASAYWQNSDGSHNWNIAPSGTANCSITFTQAMTITSGGNVIICTTENQCGLTVTSAQDNTTIRVGTTATGGQEWRLQSTGGTSGLGQGKLIFKVGTTETACFIPLVLTTDNGANGGRVGIGNTSPAYALEVCANVADWTSRFYNANATGNGLLVRINNTSTSVTAFGVYNGQYVMAVNGSGVTTFACQVCAPNAVLNCLGVGSPFSTTGGTYQTLQIKAGLSNSGFWVESCENDSGLYINHNSTSALVGGSYRTSAGFKDLQIQTAGATRIMVKCSGAVYINSSANQLNNATPALGILAGATCDAVNIKHEQNGNNTVNIWQTGTSAFGAIVFYKGNTQDERGNINVTTTGTTFNSVSDYRLKENVTPSTCGLDRLMQLKPSKFNWIQTGEEAEGFIAHELQEVYPVAVTGVKDGVYSSTGNIRPQSVDYGRITPLLVKAIQEQQCQICTQSTIIDQLKTCLGII